MIMEGRAEVVALEASRPMSDGPFRQPTVVERFDEIEPVENWIWWEHNGWYHQVVFHRSVRIELVEGRRERVEGPRTYEEFIAKSVDRLHRRIDEWRSVPWRRTAVKKEAIDAAGSSDEAA